MQLAFFCVVLNKHFFVGTTYTHTTSRYHNKVHKK
jgi:hypothetical protein